MVPPRGTLGNTYGGYSMNKEDWGELQHLKTHWYTFANQGVLGGDNCDVIRMECMTSSEWNVLMSAQVGMVREI